MLSETVIVIRCVITNLLKIYLILFLCLADVSWKNKWKILFLLK